MNMIKRLLQEKEFLILDGAMGTMLMEAGLTAGNPPEEWNVLHPERVKAVHRAYVEAGADVVLTNSFGGNRFRLQLHELGARAVELNRAAAALAREVADEAERPVIVAGSMGPTGELLQPLGTMTMEEAEAAFAEQAAALAEGGADLLWIETMSDLDEVRAAVAGARSVSDLPIAASMTFDTNRHTMMGVSPEQAAAALAELNVVAMGANCGNGPAEIEEVVMRMAATAPDVPLIAKSNAGIPRLEEGGRLQYDGTPPVMANYASYVRTLGASLIGGCCGSTPAHIAAMKASLAEPGSRARRAVAHPVETEVPPARKSRQRRHRRDSR